MTTTWATFPGPLPDYIDGLVAAPGTANGPGGTGGVAPPQGSTGWEFRVLSYKDYSTVLCTIPPHLITQYQMTKLLSDVGSGNITLDLDDPWWNAITLADGQSPDEILNFECLWQVLQDGVVRFEFFGETVTEQLVDPSEQRTAVVAGPDTISCLKWAMAAPEGFPEIILKLDGLADDFDEVDENGNAVIDTNIWTTITPSGDVYITPVQGVYSYPGGAQYALSTLYPSGTMTLEASTGTTILGSSPWDATDTLISAQITPLGTAGMNTDSSTPSPYGTGLNGSELTQMYIQSIKNSNYYALFGVSGSAFYCQLKGPSGTTTKTLPAYDPTSHAYWMITEQGGGGGGSGTFYFWTSSDGQTWTQQWSVVHNWDATECGLFFSAYYSVNSSQTAVLQNLNSNVTTASYQGNIYLSEPMGGIWLDQLSAAQARGTIPFVQTGVLNQAQDSFARPWTDSQNVQVTNGTDLYTLLQSCASVVNADYIMQPHFLLQVGQPEQGAISIGTDRSRTIVFREGRDIMTKGRTRARNQIQNLIGVENSDGKEISANDATSITSWGQREGWVQTSAQIDPLSLEIFAAGAATDNATEVLSWTMTITPDLAGKTVFESFGLGDWVGLEEPDGAGTVDAIRVIGIAIQSDNTGNETVELTLESYTAWLEQQLTYITNKLGGQFLTAPGTTPVAQNIYGTGTLPSYFSPASSLANLSDVIGAGANTPNGAVLTYNAATGTWQPSGTTNPGTGAGQVVSVTGAGGTATVTGGSVVVSGSTATTAPDGGGANAAQPQTSISVETFTVTDATGTTRTIVGVQTDGTVTSKDFNGGAPSVPDTPSVAATLQGLLVTWDGKIGSAAPLSDFLWTEVHMSVTNGFTPSTATLQGTIVTASTFPITGLTIGTTYYIKLLARNTSGVASLASSQVSGVPTSATASMIGQMGVLNANPWFTGGDGTGWAGSSGTFSVTPSPPGGSPYTDAGFFTISTAGAGAALKESAAPFPITPGTNYLATVWVYTAQTTVTLGFDWANSSGVIQSSSTTSYSVPASTWTQVTTVQTSPASGSVEGWLRIAPTDGVGHTIYVEAALALPQVPGSLIQAGTITATQIAATTITAAQIASNSITSAQIAVGTLTSANIAAGTITASNIQAGTITAGLLAAGIVQAGIVNGTTIAGATIVADGTSGEVLVYSGAPTSGNLIGSWSGSAGTDGQGNPYPLGLMAQALTLPNQASSPSAVSGASVFYSSVGGRPFFLSSSGAASVLERSVVNVADFPVTSTTPSACSAFLTYFAGEGNQSSEYEIEADGLLVVTTAGGAILFQLNLDGTDIAPPDAGIGGVYLLAASYAYTMRVRLAILNTTQAIVTWEGSISKSGANAGAETSFPVINTNVNASNNAVSFNYLTGHTLQMYVTLATGQSLNTYRTKLVRRN